jgi:hypothetical protein
MADIKISQLTPKGSAIANTDLIEISESNGVGGYVTKSVTGANIIGSKQDTLISGTNIKTINSTTILGSGNLAVQPTLVSGTNIKTINSNSILGSGDLVIGGVSSVSATTPVVATGTTTPVISLASNYGDTQNPYASKTANNILAAPNGTAGVPTFRAIVGADIPTLNQNTTGTASNVTGIVAVANGGTGTATPSLIAGTNVTITGTFPNQTINSSGGGGGGGIGGIQAFFPVSLNVIPASTYGTLSSSAMIADRVLIYPFVPSKNFTTSALRINVTTAVASANARILIYSNTINSYKPNTKILETTNLDCSTTGEKSFLYSATFTQGEVYWVAVYSNSTPSITHISSPNLFTLRQEQGLAVQHIEETYTFGTAPTTFPTIVSYNNRNCPNVGFVIA